MKLQISTDKLHRILARLQVAYQNNLKPCQAIEEHFLTFEFAKKIRNKYVEIDAEIERRLTNNPE